jgi:uncharacterized radical SAM superfamily protein
MSSEREKTTCLSAQDLMSPEDRELFGAAWEATKAHHGTNFTFYLPGMIRYGQERGRYPAISITGNRCELQCEHCKGKLLEPMIASTTPDLLIQTCHRLWKNGAHGILLSGGSDLQGKLPWEKFGSAIKRISEETGFFISAHTGFSSYDSYEILRESGVKQALIDVMGDEKTATFVYHLNGLKPVLHALEGIKRSGLELIPHIVAGLFYGKINGEYAALEIISRYQPNALVIVALTTLEETPMAHFEPPSAIEVGRLIAHARLLMPQVAISLGCERPRTREGSLMERLAIRAGANRMAIWSDEAVQEARNLGLTPRFQATCCSIDYRAEFRAFTPETF